MKKRIKPQVGSVFTIQLDQQNRIAVIILHISQLIRGTLLVATYDHVFSDTDDINVDTLSDKQIVRTDSWPDYTSDRSVRTGEWPILFVSSNLAERIEIPMLMVGPYSLYYKDELVKEFDRVEQSYEKGYRRRRTAGYIFFVKAMRRYFGFPETFDGEVNWGAPLESQYVQKKPAQETESGCTGIWEHERAFDWLSSLTQQEQGISDLLSVLQVVLADEYAEVDTCHHALAAADLVAASVGRGSTILPSEAQTWLKRHAPLPADSQQLAIRATERIRERSELQELWAESDLFSEWDGVLGDLLRRLQQTSDVIGA